MYRSITQQPRNGQLCLCRCPQWNDEGYQVARYEDGEFGYNDQPNHAFNLCVIAWLPLNHNGEPES